MCSSRRPEFGRRFELSTSAGPSSQRAFAGVRSLIEFEPPREQRTGFYLSPHFLVCAACAAASKARARHSAGRAGYVYCALSRCAMCACMRASRATARLVRRKSRERKGGPGRTVPPLFSHKNYITRKGAVTPTPSHTIKSPVNVLFNQRPHGGWAPPAPRMQAQRIATRLSGCAAPWPRRIPQSARRCSPRCPRNRRGRRPSRTSLRGSSRRDRRASRCDTRRGSIRGRVRAASAGSKEQQSAWIADGCSWGAEHHEAGPGIRAPARSITAQPRPCMRSPRRG